MADDKGKAAEGSSPGRKALSERARALMGNVGRAANAAAEAAGATALGKVAESYGKTEAASDEQLTATEQGFYDVMGKLAEKAESREERDAVREDVKKAREASHEDAKEKSKRRTTVFGQVAGAIVVLVGGTAVAMKLIKK